MISKKFDRGLWCDGGTPYAFSIRTEAAPVRCKSEACTRHTNGLCLCRYLDAAKCNLALETFFDHDGAWSGAGSCACDRAAETHPWPTATLFDRRDDCARLSCLDRIFASTAAIGGSP